MNICVMFKYEVVIKNEYSYFDEDEELVERIEEITEIMTGDVLVEFIVSCLKNSEFFEFILPKNSIIISTFAIFDGTGSKIEIKWRAINNK